ncbi:MAG: alpha/beta hydrolase [Planctomycetota bacterium]
MIYSRRLTRWILAWPRALRRRAPIVIDGQTLDERVQWLLELEGKLGAPPLTDPDAARARARFKKTTRLLQPWAAGPAEDRSFPGPAGPVPVRVYGAAPAPAPTLLFFHGGGWVLGDLDTHDGLCRTLAAQARCRVVAVDYRRAPEHPYPAAAEDAWAALEWVLREAPALGVDPARVAVGGDSAGGNLSAVVARRARDAGLGAPCLQLLCYPGLDLGHRTRSRDLFSSGFFLSDDDITWFLSLYIPEVARRDEPDASPLRAESLAGLAPACVQVAGYDPLRDEGLAYAARLREAGVAVEERVYPGLVHGFLHMTEGIPSARAAFDDAVAALRRSFGA